MAIQSSKTGEDDRLAIFMPGLWRMVFIGCVEEWYHFQQQLMLSRVSFRILVKGGQNEE